ncbi:chitin-binding protein [Haloechinothrix alba]|uniref:Chitin-binding protein n=1 Tax=Haloechinothrix alba TaxID=664784 RepID=A0A238VWC6_9PSEU|nr:lytic polysaccharide monooxygenase [Haloechinothrix alba]SNR38610.1 chitin-binding protein [Haloechinothrix alba]
MTHSTAARVGVAMFTGAATTVALGLVGAAPAAAHGYTDSPTSRQLHCADGTVTGCGQIRYEPQSVEGPDGFPEAGPADGRICSAGNEPFASLDDPRDGQWPTEQLTAGAEHEFSWSFTAAHSTERFEYFVTNDSYAPARPLTRDMLEPTPFLTVPFSGQPPFEYSHTGTLPSDKEGQHLILAVWTVADTANAFYACHDVVFGDDGSDPGDPPDPGPGPVEWDESTVYYAGDEVSHQGVVYRAQWWTRGDEPGTGGPWGVWQRVDSGG